MNPMTKTVIIIDNKIIQYNTCSQAGTQDICRGWGDFLTTSCSGMAYIQLAVNPEDKERYPWRCACKVKWKV